MSIIYDESSIAAGPIDVTKINATNAYLRHYENQLYLKFIANNPGADRVEKAQAEKELKICERKMEYWRRQPTFEQSIASTQAMELKRNWMSK